MGSFKGCCQWGVLGSQPFDLSVCFYVFVLTCEEKSSTNKPERSAQGWKHFFRSNSITAALVQFIFAVLLFFFFLAIRTNKVNTQRKLCSTAGENSNLQRCGCLGNLTIVLSFFSILYFLPGIQSSC